MRVVFACIIFCLIILLPYPAAARDEAGGVLSEAMSFMRRNVRFDFILTRKKGGESEKEETVKGKAFIKDERTYRIETASENGKNIVFVSTAGGSWTMDTDRGEVTSGPEKKNHELWPGVMELSQFEISSRREGTERIFEMVSKKDGSKIVIHVSDESRCLSRVIRLGRKGEMVSDLKIINISQEEISPNLFIKPLENNLKSEQKKQSLKPEETLPETLGAPPSPGL